MKATTSIKKSPYWFLHPIFWVVFLLFHLIDDINYIGLNLAMIRSVTYTILIAALVYFNVTFLIQQFFFKKKIIIYLLLLLVITFLATIGYEALLDSFSANKLLDEQVIEEELFGEAITSIPYFFYSFLQNIVLITSISSVLIAFQQMRTREKLAQLEKEQIHSQLNYLRSQTNPHFLFNVLNNVNFLIHKDPDKASDTLVKLSELLRYQLYETDVDFVPLQKELEHIENYIKLEEVRIGKAVDFTVAAENENIKVPPFLLLPLVENAFKHSETTGERLIQFDLKTTANDLLFRTKNNIGNAKKSKDGGLGLENLKQRLALIYPERHALKAEKQGDFFETELKIEL